MSFFAASVSPAAPATTNDVLTLTAASVRRAFVHEVSVSGLGTASAANELDVARATTVGVTPTAQTPTQIDPHSAAAASTVATAWATQPVVNAVKLLRLGCNSNGGVYRWVAKPGEEIALYSTSTDGQLSVRFGVGGAQQMAVGLIFEEM